MARNLDYIRIPLMTENGLEYLDLCRSEFGDPYSLTMKFSGGVCARGKVHLPRKWFREEILDGLADV